MCCSCCCYISQFHLPSHPLLDEGGGEEDDVYLHHLGHRRWGAAVPVNPRRPAGGLQGKLLRVGGADGGNMVLHHLKGVASEEMGMLCGICMVNVAVGGYCILFQQHMRLFGWCLYWILWMICHVKVEIWVYLCTVLMCISRFPSSVYTPIPRLLTRVKYAVDVAKFDVYLAIFWLVKRKRRNDYESDTRSAKDWWSNEHKDAL